MENLTPKQVFMSKAVKSRDKMHAAIFNKTGKFTEEKIESIILAHMSKYGFLDEQDYEDFLK